MHTEADEGVQEIGLQCLNVCGVSRAVSTRFFPHCYEGFFPLRWCGPPLNKSIGSNQLAIGSWSLPCRSNVYGFWLYCLVCGADDSGVHSRRRTQIW